MEKAWVIEFKSLYLGFCSNKITWVTVDSALRFAREIDAENFRKYALVANSNAKVSEHIWIGSDEFKININGKWVNLKSSSVIISYEKICELADIKPEYNPSVTYSSMCLQGILTKGRNVTLVDNMIINCVVTGAA